MKPRRFIPKGTKVFRIYVSRSELVKFCKDIGLVIGHKIEQKIDVPDWIKKNEKYFRACLRGLVDTDGCVFTHRYKVNGITIKSLLLLVYQSHLEILFFLF